MSDSNNNEEIKSWAIVELMGHKVVAGLIQKSEMLGKPLLRVDVPARVCFQSSRNSMEKPRSIA